MQARQLPCRHGSCRAMYSSRYSAGGPDGLFKNSQPMQDRAGWFLQQHGLTQHNHRDRGRQAETEHVVALRISTCLVWKHQQESGCWGKGTPVPSGSVRRASAPSSGLTWPGNSEPPKDSLWTTWLLLMPVVSEGSCVEHQRFAGSGRVLHIIMSCNMHGMHAALHPLSSPYACWCRLVQCRRHASKA